MSANKVRLTITVDPDMAEAAQQAVEAGRADSVSAWVSAALRDQIERDRRLQALADAVADYEAEFGEISDDEIEVQRRADREAATVARGSRRPSRTA